MSKRKATGQQGEVLAAVYLSQKGYRVLERNWRCTTGELDIVAEDKATLVFVEVRTRRGQRFGRAEESITPTKQIRLIELAQAYLQEKSPAHTSWRIDVIAVQLGPGAPQINHLENAVGW